MSKLIISMALLLVTFIVLISALEDKMELSGDEDVKNGMRASRKTREDCKFEYGADKGCEACCKKFGLHKWNVRYNPSECKCHHLPQPPQVPENIDYGKFIPHIHHMTDDELRMSPYAKYY